MSGFGWLLDPKRCIECAACEAACKQWNQVQTGAGIRYRLLRIYEDGVFPNVKVQAISMACNHCENALCVKACPVKALHQRADGIVLVNQDKCVGCGMCAKFCPYDGPQFDTARRKMQKCSMCADRIDQQLKPACVTICPTGALQWGPWEEIRAKGVDRIAHMPTPRTTRPRLRFENAGWGG